MIECLNMLAGIRIIESPNLVDWVVPEKNWVDRVLEWNPCNERKPMVAVPSPVTYTMGDIMYMHPSILASLKNIA